MGHKIISENLCNLWLKLCYLIVVDFQSAKPKKYGLLVCSVLFEKIAICSIKLYVLYLFFEMQPAVFLVKLRF